VTEPPAISARTEAAPGEGEAAPAAADTAPAEPSVATAEPSGDATPAAPAAAPLPPLPSELAALPETIGPESLRNAALAGDRIAAFEIAARYAEGRGVVPNMKTAVAWYERSASLGLAPAQYRLGSIYEKGLGVPRDLAKAQEWYRQAADAGNVKAMHNLAVLYAEGAGGDPDLENAAALFRQAAERGVRDSQFNLAILNARGLGVPQNLVEAYKWFAVAATSGDEESAKRRDIIAQALSPEELAKAKSAAAAFQPLPLVAGANEVLMPDSGWVGEDSSNVEVKSDNELVQLVQKLLAEKGYDPGPADGLLGQKTIDAISQFQGETGLPKTGSIDTDLVAALQNRST
jgi:localization factor PodJL